MAIDQDNTSNEKLLFDEDASGRYCIGSKAELLVQWKLKPEWFPGAKGNNKTSMTIDGDELLSSGFDPLITKLRIERDEECRGYFCIAMLFSDEEEERRSQVSAKENEERAYKEASDLAKGWIDGLPTSVENFKKRSAWYVNEMMTNIFNEGMASKRGGYSFDKKTVREFDLAVDALCNILINGKVNYYQFGQEQERRELAAQAFNRDLCLRFTGYERNSLVQRFMNELNAAAMSETDDVHA